MLRHSLLTGLSLVVISLQLAQQQIVPATDITGRFCTVSSEAIRVFPSEGFTRSALEPLTATRSVGPGAALVPLASELTGCLFQSFDPSFDKLLGVNRTIYRIGPNAAPQKWASESPIYYPETDELIVAAFQHMPNNTLWRVSMSTGEHTQIVPDPPIGNIGGVALYKGQIAAATSGDISDNAYPPGVYLVDPEVGNSSVLVNNWFGQRFNGLDDLLTLTDGTVIWTDSNYTSAYPPPGGYLNPTRLPTNVWILPPTGPPRALITGLPNSPNGLAVTMDEQTLFIGVGPLTADDPIVEATVNQIFAFDLQTISGGRFATNKRTFATNDFIGIDGIRVDQQGNVYGSAGEGVSVWNAGGSLIGKIIIPPLSTCPIGGHAVTSVGFAGSNLIMLRVCDILMLPIEADSATDVVNAANA